MRERITLFNVSKAKKSIHTNKEYEMHDTKNQVQASMVTCNNFNKTYFNLKKCVSLFETMVSRFCGQVNIQGKDNFDFWQLCRIETISLVYPFLHNRKNIVFSITITKSCTT